MNKQILKLTGKKELMDGVYLFEFSLQEELPFLPGQFVVLQVQPKLFRSYSILESRDLTVKFLIDVRIGGPASQFFEASKIGDELDLIGKALGKFKVLETDKPKVFIATGTGLAPFVPMIKSVLDGDQSAKVKLFFGVRTVGDNYCPDFFDGYGRDDYPNFKIFHCISRPESELPEHHHEGRVTKVVPEVFEECGSQEFYLCGNPKMVDEIQGVLAGKGAGGNLFMERYG